MKVKEKDKQVESLEILHENITNLLNSARIFLQDKKVGYAFLFLQTASEEMGRLFAFLKLFQGLKVNMPKNNHKDKHIHFIEFMSIKPVGHRSYFEIISDIVGSKINKENFKKEKVLKKIQNFREKTLYINFNSNNYLESQPLEIETKTKLILVFELYNLLLVYNRSMLKSMINGHKDGKRFFKL